MSEEHRERGGCGLQRMTIDTWLEVIEREKLRKDGHIWPGPCPMRVAKRELEEEEARIAEGQERDNSASG